MGENQLHIYVIFDYEIEHTRHENHLKAFN